MGKVGTVPILLVGFQIGVDKFSKTLSCAGLSGRPMRGKGFRPVWVFGQQIPVGQPVAVDRVWVGRELLGRRKRLFVGSVQAGLPEGCEDFVGGSGVRFDSLRLEEQPAAEAMAGDIASSQLRLQILFQLYFVWFVAPCEVNSLNLSDLIYHLFEYGECSASSQDQPVAFRF